MEFFQGSLDGDLSPALQLGDVQPSTTTTQDFDPRIPESYTGMLFRYAFNVPLTGHSIDAVLLAGNGPAWLKLLDLVVGGISRFHTASNDDDDEFGSGLGPEMSSAWEGYEAAITLTAVHGSVALKGPALWTGAGGSGDPTEAYQGRPG